MKPHIPDAPGTQTQDQATLALVERFQCPGCLHGCDVQCGAFRFNSERTSCRAHVCGTFIGGVGYTALGMPKGFCRPGWKEDNEPSSRLRVRLFPKGVAGPVYDRLNIPVWALEEDGFLFVRTALPRISLVFVDVIEGGTLALVPNALDVATFEETFD